MVHPMGGWISSSLADLFLSYYKEKSFEECLRDFKPTLCSRYVDDCFVFLDSEAEIAPFLQHLNSQHVSIKFKCEREYNNKLVFLDILITKTPTSFDTGVFRKKNIFINSNINIF